MNATPQFALVGLKLPSNITKQEVDELALGFKKACDEYNITIIGGDSVSGDCIDISVTIISQSNNPIRRDGLKVGDILCFTGELGEVQRDLNILLDKGKVKQDSKFIKPILHDKFFYEISDFITSALDISDGLSKDLSRLATINSLGFAFFKELSDEELCSGEEYEILFSFNEKDLDKIIKIASKHSVKINIFAQAIQGSYKTRCKENHF
jgi:thiamine-monophosphate kinase